MTITLKAISTVSSKELLAAYNEMAVALGEKPTARFSTRSAGERRTAAILARYVEAFPVVRRSASEGIADSWKDPEVAAKRTTRNRVVVDGEEFKSFRDAWRAKGFDDKAHIKYRMVMKTAGQVEFNGKTFYLGEQY